ncbi:MAG TPA: SulP family inorganic anion transporter, partial [Mycobacterium sp.]|nr:SulP family inorganic anion transporter [Mycobacterium sp.]
LRRLVQRFRWPQIDLLTVLLVATLIAYAAGWSIPGSDGKTAVSVAAKVPQSLPGSGSLSRSAINFHAGAVTRFSGVVSAATVAVALLLFAPLLHYVPQAALAGLLIVTAVRLVDVTRLISTVKASRYDAGLVIVTALTGVLIDLDKAVLLGIALSILLFVPRAAKLKAAELTVTPERVVRERIPSDPVHPSTVIYDLEGELFFGAAPELDRYFDSLRARIRTGAVKFVVLRLKRVRHPDAVSIERLEHFLREENARGVTILLAGVQPDTLTVLNNIGFERWFPAEQVFVEEEGEEDSATLKAVRHTRASLDDEHRVAAPAGATPGSDPLYYLV